MIRAPSRRRRLAGGPLAIRPEARSRAAEPSTLESEVDEREGRYGRTLRGAAQGALREVEHGQPGRSATKGAREPEGSAVVLARVPSVFDSPAERRARAFTTRTRGTSTQRVRRAPAPAPRPFQRTTRVPRAVAAPVAAPADPFAVGATVELHGLVSKPAANGRRVVVVQTPEDVARGGRICVNLDRAVIAVKRENVRAVPGGVGAAPSTAAMAWLTPGFLSNSPWGLVVRVLAAALASTETLALDQVGRDKPAARRYANAKRWIPRSHHKRSDAYADNLQSARALRPLQLLAKQSSRRA